MAFKTCTFCGHVWETREDFLAEPDLVVAGYQVNYGDLVAGLFLFTHETPACGTSLAIRADEFTDMHKGEMFEQCLSGSELCDNHCGSSHDLESCPNKCECAYVRDVLHVVNKWPKSAAQAQAT